MPVIPGIAKPILESRLWTTLASRINRWTSSPRGSHRGMHYDQNHDSHWTGSQKSPQQVDTWAVNGSDQQPWQIQSGRSYVELESLNER